MAVAYVADGQDTDDTINSVNTTGADYLIAAACGWRFAAAANVTGCTWNGDSAAMTEVVTAKTSTNDLEVGLWEYIGPSSTTSTISVSKTAAWDGGDGGPMHSWIVFSGVDQTTPTDATATDGGSGAASFSLATTTGDMILDVINDWVNTALAGTGGGSPVERWEQVNVNNDSAGYTRTGNGSITCSVSGSISDFGYAGCNIVAAAAGGGAAVHYYDMMRGM